MPINVAKQNESFLDRYRVDREDFDRLVEVLIEVRGGEPISEEDAREVSRIIKQKGTVNQHIRWDEASRQP